MRVPFVLLAVAIAIVGAETGATESEETTTATRPAETTDANPAANNSEPSSETQAAGPWDWIPDGGNEREICLGLRCKDNPKVCIGNRQLCDGRNDCRDGSDEDPRFCQFFTSGLAPGEFMSITANMTRGHLAVEVYLCTSQQCNGISPHEWENTKLPKPALYYFKRTGCNNRGQKCKWEETRRTGTWGPRGQHTYVLENHVDHLTLKRTDQPDTVGTVEITPGANNVVVHPFRFRQWETYSVTFGERQRLPAFMSSLMTKLASLMGEKASADDMDKLTSLAKIVARDDHDKRAVHWMQLAAATVPKAPKESGFALATNVLKFLTGALDDVAHTKQLQDKFITDNLHDKASQFSKELGLRFQATQRLVDTQLLPQINNVALALQNQTALVKERKANTETEIAARNKELDELNSKLSAWKIASIFGKVLGMVASIVSVIPGGQLAGAGIAVGATVISEVASGMMAQIKDEIAAVKEKIAKEKDISASMEHLMKLLNTSSEMIIELEKVKSDSLSVRAWLTGPSMIKFKSQLVFLTIEDLSSATGGRIIVDILVSASRSLVDGLDKLEWYQSQRTIVDLTTTTLSTGDSEETRVGLSTLRQLVGQHMALADYRTTMRSLQQYALPFCSLLVTSQTEACHENRTLSELVTCSKSIYTDVLNKLNMEQGSIGRDRRLFGTFYRRSNDDDRSFVTWKNAEYASSIADLLAGKEVALKADVFASQSNTKVVKFNVVELQFWIEDEKTRKELNSALRFFKVALTHTGDSHYMCGSDVVGLSHRPINMTYTVKKNPRGVPMESLGDYLLVRDGDMLLSPYATWTVQLLPYIKDKADYTKLQRFASQADLSLSGKGSYVTESATCDGCVWDFKVIQPSGQAAAPAKQRIYTHTTEEPPLDPEDLKEGPASHNSQ